MRASRSDHAPRVRLPNRCNSFSVIDLDCSTFFIADETPYRLAYEEAVRAAASQASILDSVRSSAATLLAAAALVTSFLGGLALTGKVESSPGTLGWIAIGFFLGTATLSLVALLPFGVWKFGLDAALIIGLVEERESADPVSAVEAYRELALRLRADYDENNPKLRVLFWCLRAGMLLLACEVASWVFEIART